MSEDMRYPTINVAKDGDGNTLSLRIDDGSVLNWNAFTPQQVANIKKVFPDINEPDTRLAFVIDHNSKVLSVAHGKPSSQYPGTLMFDKVLSMREEAEPLWTRDFGAQFKQDGILMQPDALAAHIVELGWDKPRKLDAVKDAAKIAEIQLEIKGKTFNEFTDLVQAHAKMITTSRNLQKKYGFAESGLSIYSNTSNQVQYENYEKMAKEDQNVFDSARSQLDESQTRYSAATRPILNKHQLSTLDGAFVSYSLGVADKDATAEPVIKPIRESASAMGEAVALSKEMQHDQLPKDPGTAPRPKPTKENLIRL